jgi:hypothetical protein
VVSFKKGGLQVRCHAWDRNLGGRDIDELLFDHFCKEFQAKHKLDIKTNAKASFKLRTQCQRIKKVSCFSIRNNNVIQKKVPFALVPAHQSEFVVCMIVFDAPNWLLHLCCTAVQWQ